MVVKVTLEVNDGQPWGTQWEGNGAWVLESSELPLASPWSSEPLAAFFGSSQEKSVCRGGGEGGI